MYVVYGRTGCPYCSKAVALLEQLGEDYEYLEVSPEFREELIAKYNHRTVPLIVDDGELVGGYTELKEYLHYHNSLDKVLWWVGTLVSYVVDRPAYTQRMKERQQCLDSCSL